MIELLARPWQRSFVELASKAQNSLVICSPFVSESGVKLLADAANDQFKAVGELQLLTDLSPTNICASSTDPKAIKALARICGRNSIRHLSCVHAKVYIADSQFAIVTSGNLTRGGLFTNYEYGVSITDPTAVRQIHADITEYASLGTMATVDRLEVYAAIAEQVKELYDRQQAAAVRNASDAFRRAVREAEDELLRARLSGGPVHSVFERTVLYLLRRNGPMTTRQLHQMIESIHPDLCDDSVNRVIGGKGFGKKWKHAVRTAQQHLKARGVATSRDGRWVAIP